MRNADINDVIDNLINTYIDTSQIHGLGLFAKIELKKGDILGLLDGQIVDWELQTKYSLSYEWNAISDNKLLVRPYRTKYSYINHSRQPNLLILYNPIRVVADEDIPKNTELSLDYRSESLNKEYLENQGKQYL